MGVRKAIGLFPGKEVTKETLCLGINVAIDEFGDESLRTKYYVQLVLVVLAAHRICVWHASCVDPQRAL